MRANRPPHPRKAKVDGSSRIQPFRRRQPALVYPTMSRLPDDIGGPAAFLSARIRSRLHTVSSPELSNR